MSLTQQQIKHMAQLVQISLDAPTADQYAQQLQPVVDGLENLAQVNVGQTQPMTHPIDQTATLREDEVTETNQRDTFQQIAPAVADGVYLVPKVID